MKTVSAKQFRAQFDACLRATKRSPIIVTRNAKPVAMLLSIKSAEDAELVAMSRSKKLNEILDESERQIKQGKGIPEEQFWAGIEEMRRRQKNSRRRRSA